MHVFMCVRVYVCVCVCGGVCVFACVCVCVRLFGPVSVCLLVLINRTALTVGSVPGYRGAVDWFHGATPQRL